jgi:hypothetical protein
VSTLWAVANPAVAPVIERAQQAAVKDTLTPTEQTLVHPLGRRGPSPGRRGRQLVGIVCQVRMLALAAETEQHPFTGAGVDHREAEACFEPAPRAGDGYRRIYPDLPGLGRTPAPLSLRSADDVLQTLRLRRLGERTRRPTRSRPLGRLREVSALTT